jgi:hypothetical protein
MLGFQVSLMKSYLGSPQMLQLIFRSLEELPLLAPMQVR